MSETSGHPPDPPGASGPIYGDVPRYGYQRPGASGPGASADPSAAPGPVSSPSAYPPVAQPPSGPPSGYPTPGPAQSYPPPAPPPPGSSPGYPTQGQPAAGPVPGYPDAPYPTASYPSAPYPPAGYPAAYAPVPRYPYSPWGRRVGAFLIDFIPSYVATAVFYVGYVQFLIVATQRSAYDTAPASLTGPIVWLIIGGVLLLAAFGWQIYNRWLVAGRTGQSLGKRALKINLVAEATGQPIGPLNAFLRDLLHILDGIAYVGYLWPLWDDKRQTFADKLMKTVVADRPPELGATPH